jgi:branched-chain amino acid transport system substrate-binding protein
MQIMMGTVTSAPCIAVEAEASNDNMFLITPSGTAVDCISGSNAFRLCFSDPAQGTKSAEYIGVNKLATKVAIIYDSSDPYSAGICESFKAEASKQGINVVASEAFTADSKTDFKVQLQKAKDSGAELLFLPIYYQEASLILSQANEMGFAPKIFGCDGLDGILGVENFDVKLAEGVMLLTPFAADAQDDLTKKFVTTYAEKFNGEVPMQFAADAYDAIYAIKAAIEKSGATSDMSASELCDKMSAAMTEISLTGLTGTITWDASGEPNKEPKAVVIENGAYKAMQ